MTLREQLVHILACPEHNETPGNTADRILALDELQKVRQLEHMHALEQAFLNATLGLLKIRNWTCLRTEDQWTASSDVFQKMPHDDLCGRVFSIAATAMVHGGQAEAALKKRGLLK